MFNRVGYAIAVLIMLLLTVLSMAIAVLAMVAEKLTHVGLWVANEISICGLALVRAMERD
jgi:hypothetical protein